MATEPIAPSELSIAKARLAAVGMAIQRWTVIEALDDDGKPIGWGIAVDGYEDDGWLFYLPEKEQAALVVKAHNREHDDVDEAIYGDGHLSHLLWPRTRS